MNKEINTLEQRYVSTNLSSSASSSSSLIFIQALHTDGLFGTMGRLIGVDTMEGPNEGDREMHTPLQTDVVL